MNDNTENFADMLDKSMSDFSTLKPGEQRELTIVSVTDDCIFLDLGGKSEGILDASELRDKEGNLSVKTGDRIKAFFLNAHNGEFKFTTKISGEKGGDSLLEEAFRQGIPVEGVVDSEIKGGFQIKIGASRAFCPYSQMGIKRVEDASQYVGRTLTFRIQEYKENGRNILVSNRVIIEAEQVAHKEELKKKLSVGQKVKATVKSIQKFGAFVEINGLQALLPISEISRKRIEDVSEVLKTGMEIEATILNLDWDRDRISVSMKALEADPWDDAGTKYEPGSKHTGTVVRLTNFGAFVSLESGVDGLLHISELDGEKRVNHPREVLKLSQTLEVTIKSVDPAARKISLSLPPKTNEY